MLCILEIITSCGDYNSTSLTIDCINLKHMISIVYRKIENTILIMSNCNRCIDATVDDILQNNTIQHYLSELGQNWRLNDKGHLDTTYKVKDFQEAMSLANRIAIIAESQDHHPTITILWGECYVEIWTHKVNGVTDMDIKFIKLVNETLGI